VSTVFPIDQVKALRLEARDAAQVPRGGPEGWSKSDTSPMALLAVFTALRIRSGYVLRAYQFRSGGNGNGVVWALREDAPFPEPGDCPNQDGSLFRPPRPPGALDNYMEAIEGDGAPWSYFSASLFAREAAEFGAIWHGANWSCHTILGADPWSSGPGQAGAEGVKWSAAKPDVWQPCVRQEQGVVTVLFHTFTALGQERLFRHRDTFRAGQHAFRPEAEVIAVGGLGYVH
jgi:hypothetical protein